MVAQARQSGARKSRPPGISAVFRQHWYSIKTAGLNLRANAGTVIVNTAILGITLALPVGLHELVVNLERLSERWRAVPQASLFLAEQTTTEQAETLMDTLRRDPRFTDVTFVDKSTALNEFGGAIGIPQLQELTDANPLPDTIIVTLDAARIDLSRPAEVTASLGAFAEVSDVQIDYRWIARFRRISELVLRVTVVVGVVLAVGVVLISGHTVRSNINRRRVEIEVSKLCGATDAFVRRPFLYWGTVQGLAGALTACVIVQFGLLALERPTSELTALYGSDYRIGTLSLARVILIGGLGAALGWIGAWAAVTLYLRAARRAGGLIAR